MRADGVPVPPVVLLSYRLSGTITDAAGKPVARRLRRQRTNDRDYWTFSEPTNAAGKYALVLPGVGPDRGRPGRVLDPGRRRPHELHDGRRETRRSSVAAAPNLDLKLPASGIAMALPVSTPVPGAIYRGTLVGVSAGTGVVQPVSATWPDAQGRFQLILPASVAGKTLRFWQSDFQAYQTTPATPGGRVDLKAWPAALAPRVARDTAFARGPA